MMDMTRNDEPRFVSGAEIFQAERENRGEHDGVKEADEDDGEDGDRTGGANADQGGGQRADAEDGEKAGGFDALHHPGAGETADHEADLMGDEEQGGHFLGAVGNEPGNKGGVLALMRSVKLRAPIGHADERLRHGLLGKPNQKAGDADLCADVEELGDHAFDEMRM